MSFKKINQNRIEDIEKKIEQKKAVTFQISKDLDQELSDFLEILKTNGLEVSKTKFINDAITERLKIVKEDPAKIIHIQLENIKKMMQ